MIQDNCPLVSVLMPSYNHERYIGFAIDSVLNQTYKNIELIIIDDGSVDKTWDILKRYSLNDKVKIYKQVNKGLVETLKVLRGLATGKYLTILASDDRFYPKKLELMVDLLEKNPDFAMCSGKTDVIDENNFFIKKTIGEYSGKGKLYEGLIKGETYISYVSVLVRAEEYGSVNFFDPFLEDLPAWIQISKKYNCLVIDEVVASYRKTPGSMTKNVEKMVNSEMRVIAYFVKLERGTLLRYPPGWSARWINTYSTISPWLAIKFIASNKCNYKIIFYKNFYKFIIRSFLFLIKKPFYKWL